MHPLENLNDEELMLRYQNDDSLAFELLYKRNKSRVYSYIKKRIFDQDSHEDVYQKVFEKFHKTRMYYDSEYLLLKWIYTISFNVVTDHLRKVKRDHDKQDIEKEFTAFQNISKDENESVEEMISHLNTREQNLMKLRFIEGQEFKEISKLTDLSESNARKIVSRSIKKLKLKLAGPIQEAHNDK